MKKHFLCIVALAVLVAVAFSSASVVAHGQSSGNYELDKASTPGAAGDAFSGDYHASGSSPESVAGETGDSTSFRLSFELTPEQYGPEDTDPPVITDGPDVVYLSDTVALIQWETDEIASGFVEYGLDDTYGQTETRTGPFSTFHQVLLTGLTPDETYHFRVGSTDPFLNGPTFSGDNQFTTDDQPDTDDPVISNVVATPLGVTALQITFDTDKPSSTLVEWGPSATLGTDLPDPAFRTSHTRVITGITPGTTVFYEITATDPAGNDSSAGTDSIVMPGAVEIVTSALEPARRGRSYSETIDVIGGVGALTFSLTGTGTLPPGLSLNPSTGEISGTPTERGLFTFSVQVSDSGTPASLDVLTFGLQVTGGSSKSSSGCSTTEGRSLWWLLLPIVLLMAVARRGLAGPAVRD